MLKSITGNDENARTVVGWRYGISDRLWLVPRLRR